jgi:hypothetical protein
MKVRALKFFERKNLLQISKYKMQKILNGRQKVFNFSVILLVFSTSFFSEIGFNYSFLIPDSLDRVPSVFVEDHYVVNLNLKYPIQINYDHKFVN